MSYCIPLFFKHDDFRVLVKEVCKANNISYLDLADMTGYSAPAISTYMTGKNSKFVPAAIAKALDIDLNLLKR